MTLDISRHRRRLQRRMEDPEFRAEFERMERAIARVDAIMRTIDALRQEANLSKAELARAIGKDPASVRRLLTGEANPTMATVMSLLDALGADIEIRKRPDHDDRLSA
jgi:ribosome-binding protein aMBF1 (putative translation factor)